jgi:hypothetical protein
MNTNSIEEKNRRMLPTITKLSFVNDDKNVPEQKAMTVNNEGYEEAFEDVNRPNVESASEVVKTLQKKVEDVVKERDILNNEIKGSKKAHHCSCNMFIKITNCPSCPGCQQLSFTL